MILITSGCGTIVLSEHQMALITSDCAPFRSSAGRCEQWPPTTTTCMSSTLRPHGAPPPPPHLSASACHPLALPHQQCWTEGESRLAAATPMENPYCSCKAPHRRPPCRYMQDPSCSFGGFEYYEAELRRRAAPYSKVRPLTQHGLSFNRMALITSGCGTMCYPSIKWP